MRKRKGITAADWAAIVIVALSIALLSMQVYRDTGNDSQVVIEGGGEMWVYSLDTDVHTHIPGPLSETEVIIQDGSVHIPASPCRDKICISMGQISRPGQWIICLPNDVFVRVEGVEAEDREVDDVAF